MVAKHVEMGRKEMDFSEWRTYYPATRRRKLEWMGRALHEEVMPPFTYRIIHPGSRLSNQDRAALEQWIESEIARSARIGGAISQPWQILSEILTRAFREWMAGKEVNRKRALFHRRGDDARLDAAQCGACANGSV